MILGCQGSKGKGSEFRHETAREREGRRGASPFLLPREPFVLLTHPYPLSLPFGILQKNGWDTFVSPCPLNVGVQGLVTEQR